METNYSAAASIHRGDGFHVYNTGPVSLVIVREDGQERSVQGDDASELEGLLICYADVFDTPEGYVKEADAMLSAYFED